MKYTLIFCTLLLVACTNTKSNKPETTSVEIMVPTEELHTDIKLSENTDTLIDYPPTALEKEQPSKSQKQKTDLIRVEQWGFPISEEYLQTYVTKKSSCYSTTYRENETDYFLGYNDFLHTIDILDLTHKKPYKQIKLDREGSQGVFPLYGIEYYKGGFVVEDEVSYFRLSMDGKITSRKAKKNLYEQFEGYGKMKPGLFIYIDWYNFLCFNPETGEVAITLYGNKPDLKPIKVMLVSCDNWEITETVDIAYPDFILKEGNMGALSDVHAYPCTDRILYNFPASSNIYSIDRKTKKTTLYEIPSSIVSNFLKVIDGSTDEDMSIISGYYFPLQYDAIRKKFWRIQVDKKIQGYRVFENTPFAISCIDSDMKDYSEYAIPKNLTLYPNSLFFEGGVLFPYLQAPAEDDIVFYFMQTGK